MRGITSRACTRSCRRTCPTISCWRPARPVRCASSSSCAFAEVGRSIEWRGKGVDETGVDGKSGKTVVRIDPVYFRPTEVDLLVGDASKAREKLGWKPKTSFAQLVKEMVASDLEEARREVANGKHSV